MRALLIASIFLSPAAAMAERVGRINVDDDGDVTMWTASGGAWDDSVTSNTCRTAGTQVVRFQVSTPGGESMLKVALSARLAGKEISVKSYANQCIDGVARISSIDIDAD